MKYRGSSVDKKYIRSEFFNENPRFTSIKQIREHDAIEARKAVNLTNATHDQKDEVGAPSLAFIKKPAISSKSMLAEHRRNKMLNELKKNEVNFGSHLDGQARIIGREDCNLRQLSLNPPSKNTRQAIIDKRRQDMIMENVGKFGD